MTSQTFTFYTFKSQTLVFNQDTVYYLILSKRTTTLSNPWLLSKLKVVLSYLKKSWIIENNHFKFLKATKSYFEYMYADTNTVRSLNESVNIQEPP